MHVIIFPCSLPKRQVRFLALPLMQFTQLRELNCKRKEGWMQWMAHMVLMDLVAVWQWCTLLCFRVLSFLYILTCKMSCWLICTWIAGCSGGVHRNGVTSVTSMAWKKKTCREGKTCQAGLYRGGNASKLTVLTHSSKIVLCCHLTFPFWAVKLKY